MLRLLLIAAVLLATGPLTPVAHADPVFPRASRVGLEPTGDLKLATGFPGLEDPDRKVKVAILDLPRQSYDELLNSTFSENQRGLTNLKRESFGYRSGVGFLVSADATEDGVPVRRYFLIGMPISQSADDDLVGLVRVSVPMTARDAYGEEAVRAMLATMTFRTVPVQEQLASLPFTVDNLGGYRVLRVLAGGSSVILIDGAGQDLTRQPYMILSVGAAPAPRPDDRGRAAQAMLAGAPIKDLDIKFAEPQRIGGAPGYEIRAQGVTPNGNPVSLVQWVRFGTSGFLRIVGVTPRGDWDAQFPRFRAVRDGIGAR